MMPLQILPNKIQKKEKKTKKTPVCCILSLTLRVGRLDPWSEAIVSKLQ